MTPPATESARAARAARRRLVLADFVRLAGTALLWGSVAAAGLMAADRLGVPLAPRWSLIVFPLVAGICAALLLAFVRRPSLAAAAARLDRSLGLRDRVSTALALRADAGPFHEWARDEGERAARDSDPSKAAALRADWTWGAWPLVLAACVAGAVFAPRMTWTRDSGPRATAAERLAASERVAAAAEIARAETAAVQEATRDDLAAIQDLEAGLRAGEADPAQAMTRAAGRLESMARDLEERATASGRAADAVRDRLVAAGVPRGQNTETEHSTALRDALSRGDLPAAEAAANELAGSAGQMSGAQRQELARDLDALAAALPDEPAPTSPKDAASRARQEGGVQTEAADEIARQTDPRQVQEELERRGMEPEAARQAAERAAEARRQEKAEGDARGRVDDLREALKDAAESVRKGEESAPPKPEGGAEGEQPMPGEQPGQDPRRTGESAHQEPKPGSDRGSEPPSADRPAGDSKGPEPADGKPSDGARKPGESGTRRETPPQGKESAQDQPAMNRSNPGESQPKPGPEPSGSPGQTPARQGDPKPGEGETPRGKETPAPPRGDQLSGGEQTPKSGEPKGAKPDGAKGDRDRNTPSPQPTPGPNGNEGQKPGSTPGGPGAPQGHDNQPGESPRSDKPGGLRGLQRQLQEMARSRDNARDLRQRAQRLRDASRELTQGPGGGHGQNSDPGRGVGNSDRENATPPAPPPSRVAAEDTPVDARSAPPEAAAPRERVIAEWYSPHRAHPAAARGSAMQNDLRAAARGAERAVEQQSVPARHADLVRRVFRRYAERAAPP